MSISNHRGAALQVELQFKFNDGYEIEHQNQVMIKPQKHLHQLLKFFFLGGG